MYRIYRREPIRCGRWYYAANCKNCRKLVYMIDDLSCGKSPVSLMGDGFFSVPCGRCYHHNIYAVDEISVVQSKEDLSGQRPDRVAISKSSRKPLSRYDSNAVVTIGVGYIEDRPKAAAIVARIITSWADVEVQCARLLAELMETNIPAVAAVFGSLRTGRAQSDALEAGARVVLNEKDFELFTAYMSRRSSLEKERNDLAHGCYGVALNIPDAVIWMAQSDYLAYTVNFKSDPDALKKIRDRQFVYELGTLERIAQEIEEFHGQLSFFIGYLSTRNQGDRGEMFRAERYQQLCQMPHIRAALERVRSAKGKVSKPAGNAAKRHQKRARGKSNSAS